MIGRALALAGGDLVDMLGGPLGDEARAARGECARASQRERAQMIAELRAPMPPGLRGVHPSWIEAALAELPARARAAVAGATHDPTDVWLARWACASIPPLPPVRAGATRTPAEAAALIAAAPVRTVGDVVALPGAALEAWLRAVGQAQLDYAVSLAQPGAPRKPELGGARAVIARCRLGDPLRIGAAAIAPHVSPLAARQLAHRLPRETGFAILAELHAHAGDSVADAPVLS